MVKIFVCTGNAGKLAEFRACLLESTEPSYSVLGIRELEALSGLRYVEPPEEADCFLANALTKLEAAQDFLREVAKKTGVRPGNLASRILVDDSGLCVPALGFLPGVHSATFGGLPRDDAKNRAALRARIASAGAERLEAFFVCYALSAGVDATIRCAASPADAEALERGVHFPMAARACAAKTPCGGVAADLAAINVGFGF